MVDIYYYSQDKFERKTTSNLDDISQQAIPDWASVAWFNVDGLLNTFENLYFVLFIFIYF